MLGTSKERRYMGPAGSQTQHHHNSQPNSNNQQTTGAQHLTTPLSAPFPSFFSPYSHFQHLSALHTSFGGSNLSSTDLILSQTSAHTSNHCPGSPTLSSTTNGHLPQTPTSVASSGRISAFDFYTNGQVTDSLLSTRGYNTQPSYLPVSSLDFVAKNFQAAAVAAQFSQAKSLFLQAQSDLYSNTISNTKRSETCFGRWQKTQQEHVFEPLHIHVPPISTPSNIQIKSENISSGSSVSSQQKSSSDSNQFNGLGSLCYSPPKSAKRKTTVSASPSPQLSNGSKPLSVTQKTHTATSVPSTSTHTKATDAIHSVHDITSGCSRTIPIPWNNSSLLQIKREPCQVSEVTTSNNIPPTASVQQQKQDKTIITHSSIIKSEIKSPTEATSSSVSISTATSNMEHNNTNTVQSGAIPVGIAVARQRLQEHAQQQQHQTKDINRFGNIGIATDLGGAISAFTQQNMFYTGTNSTMIPFSSDVATAAAVSMGVSNIQSTVRTPPTLWQYPAPVPMESMLPPVPFQLLRDPNSGQFLFFPTAATSIEPFQQAVVWPTTYSQPQTTIQPAPHLLMPPITAAPSIQPPPLAPLLLNASDYLSAGATLHQHTQTHSTRLVALASDNNNKRKSSHNPTIPLPIQPAPTLIKIEDSVHSGVPTLAPFEPKSTAIQTATIAGTQTNEVNPDISTQLGNYYQTHGLHGNLIQLAPHTSVGATQTLPNGANGTALAAGLPLLNTLDCRTLQPQPMPHILTPPDVTISTMSCLTPISETYSRCDENLDSSAVSTIPDVQDATIQTDTPVMSEDDNTSGADDSGYALHIVNSNSSTDEMNVSVPTSTSCAKICHSMMDNSAETSSIMSSSPQNTSPQSTSAPDLIHSSTNGTNISEETNKSLESSFEMAVSSTNTIEDERQFNQVTPESDVGTSNMRTVTPQSPHQVSGLTINSNVQYVAPQIQSEKPVKSIGPDISGLELLSNSIEAFEKRPFIKQEPIDRSQVSPVIYEYSSYNAQRSNSIEANRSNAEQFESRQTFEERNTPPQTPLHKTSFVPADDQLGGLNLLCALAERHFQEEVSNEHRLERKRSPSSSEGSEPKRVKKHKDKNSSKKSKKKERKAKKRHSSECSNGISSTEDAVEKDFRETFDRIKEKYMKCDCRKSSLNEPCCCKMKFPTPEEVYSAMKSEMRNQLAEIKRKVKEEERKLDAINSKERLQRESTPSSSKSSSSSSKLSFTSMPTFSPSILSTSSIECNQSNVAELSSNGKIYSDTESCSSTSSKRKMAPVCEPVDSQAKKSKSLVGFIFASKKRINDSKFESSQSATDDGSIHSDKSTTFQRNPIKIKQEIYDFDDAVQQPEIKRFSSLSDESRIKNHLSGTSEGTIKLKPSALSKHNKKTDAELKLQRRNSEIKHKCLITDATLDSLTDGKKQRVLTAMGGLFYAGSLNAVSPPDLYGVTLDGERGNKAHIMSREDILRDVILEVAPTSADEVPPGSRLCAYWSQQYRCLYPGTVAVSSSPDYELNSKYVVVEFDDGDSGRIAIEDIRFLTCDYPVVEYDPNPLQSLGKRNKQRANVELTDPNQPSTSGNVFSFHHEPSKPVQTREEKEANKERRRLKKLRKDKLRHLSSNDDPNIKHRHKHKHKCTSGDECKHRKHKKRRKHKKHHHRELGNIMQSNSALTKDDVVPKTEHYDEEQDNDSVESQEVPKVVEKHEESKKLQLKNHLTKSVNIKLNKIDWPLDEDLVSSVTEDSSGSSYNPKKVKTSSNEKTSKIAAFLPARQLWAWSGKGFKRTTGKGARNKKIFYKTIQRGKETISVGDSAVFLSTGRPDRPYIGRIESLWESNSNNRVVKVKWYYHPEETNGCPDLTYPGALFESPHEDENDVQTISHKCKVLPLNAYTKKYGPDPKQYTSVYDNNDTFYLAGYYDPTIMQLKMEKNIPTSGKKNDNDDDSASIETNDS